MKKISEALVRVVRKNRGVVDEAQSSQAKTTMKHISNPTEGEKKAAKKMKSGIPGYRDRIAMPHSAAARGALKKEEVEDMAESYTGRETKDGTWHVFKTGKAVAVAGPFKSREEVSAWIKKQKIEEAQFWGNKGMVKQANAASGTTTTMRGRDAKGVYTATLVRKKGESEHKEVSRVYDTKEEVDLDEALDFKKEAAKHMKDLHDKNSTPANKAYAQKMLQRALEASKMKDKVAAAKHYMGEEVEQIDELKKSTIASYIKKASSSSHPNSTSNLASRAAEKLASGGDDDGEKDDHKSFMRSKNIGKAVDRLAKEETSYAGKGNHRPGWMLRADPGLAKKFKEKQELAKKRQAAYGNPAAGKSV